MTSFNFAPNVEEIEQSDAQERAGDFRLALQDPDRGRPHQTSGLPRHFEVHKEPTEDDDHQSLLLRCIPVYEWLDLRKEHPNER